jgi:hypothetical protein
MNVAYRNRQVVNAEIIIDVRQRQSIDKAIVSIIRVHNIFHPKCISEINKKVVEFGFVPDAATEKK